MERGLGTGVWGFIGRRRIRIGRNVVRSATSVLSVILCVDVHRVSNGNLTLCLRSRTVLERSGRSK